jgi:carbonic anhydrase
VLLQHTDCGTSHLTKELVHERIAESKEPDSEETVKMREEVCEWKVSRGEEGVRMDLEFLRGKGFLRKELVESAVGFWMDTTTGIVKRVN